MQPFGEAGPFGGLLALDGAVDVSMTTAETNTVTLWAHKGPAPVQATAAVDGTPVTAETTVPGQQAHVRFPGVAGTRYLMSCDLTGSGREGFLRMMSPSGNLVRLISCSPRGNATTVPLTQSGDYLLDFYFKRDGIGKVALAVKPAS